MIVQPTLPKRWIVLRGVNDLIVNILDVLQRLSPIHPLVVVALHHRQLTVR